jgi:hypothetical protein
LRLRSSSQRTPLIKERKRKKNIEISSIQFPADGTQKTRLIKFISQKLVLLSFKQKQYVAKMTLIPLK